MNLLIIDPDTGIQEYYNHLFRSIFKNLNISYAKDCQSALEYLQSREADLVITDTVLPDCDIFSILSDLIAKNLPVIIISSEKSDRLIVESLRAGALDFLTKKKLRQNLLEHVIKRAFLEGDRWMEILRFGKTIPHRQEYGTVDEVLKTFLVKERHEKRNMNLPMGYLADGSIKLHEGESYQVIYLYMQLHIPDEMSGHYDQESIAKILGDVLLMNINISERYGGRTWTKKNDGAFFAFLNESYQQAVLAALSIYSAVNLFSLRFGHDSGKIKVTMGIAAGQTVYHENKSSIYSEALNLSAHLAINKEMNGSAVWITSDIFNEISDSAGRYFETRPDYEDQKVYQFVMNPHLTEVES
ncbi:MAG: response regulator [Spirochaetia bacterium]|nr:response regulator [Spirochaetia bacterium]